MEQQECRIYHPTQLNKNDCHKIDVHAFPSASTVSMTQFLHSNNVQKLPRTQYKATSRKRNHKLLRVLLSICYTLINHFRKLLRAYFIVNHFRTLFIKN